MTFTKFAITFTNLSNLSIYLSTYQSIYLPIITYLSIYLSNLIWSIYCNLI
jgi:hypothetical protein